MYRNYISEGNTIYQLIVPEKYQSEILKYYHDIPSAAHLGTDKMLERIRQRFYWVALKKAVQEYCAYCVKCAARKPPKEQHAPLGPYQVGEPMEKVGVDRFRRERPTDGAADASIDYDSGRWEVMSTPGEA